MAELKTREALEAYEKVLLFNSEEDCGGQFEKDIDSLVRAVQSETELALMRGENIVLSEKAMLLENLYCAISLCNRPIQREAAYSIIKKALDKYLGIRFPRPSGKRRRRKLLHPD